MMGWVSEWVEWRADTQATARDRSGQARRTTKQGGRQLCDTPYHGDGVGRSVRALRGLASSKCQTRNVEACQWQSPDLSAGRRHLRLQQLWPWQQQRCRG
eukprot:scaffold139307_cov26-Tisochrysis_lutea.AAC.1